MSETQSITTAIAIPALQAGISSGFTALAIGAVGRVAGWAQWPDAALFSAGVVGLAVWTWQVREWSEVRRLEVEALFDPAPVPEPLEVPAPSITKVHVHSDDEKTIEIIDLPTEPYKLGQLAAAVLESGPGALAEAQWTGAGALFGRAEFQRLRGELVRRGLLAWNNPASPARGLTVTRPGMAAMRHFAQWADMPRGIK